MGARKENLRAALFAAHIIDIGADPVAIAEIFARNGFIAADDRFTLAKVDNHIAVFNALDGAVDNLANAVLEFLKLLVAFCFTNLLHDNLFGRLGCNAAKIHRRQRLGNMIAKLGVGVLVAGKIQAEFASCNLQPVPTTSSRRCSLISPVLGSISALTLVS